MNNKKIKLQLVNWIDFILETQNIFRNIIGASYFEKEFLFLEKFRKNIHKMDISDKDFEKIEFMTKNLCQEINNCILNLNKLKYIQN
ncbi:hypothetical protein JCM13304A_01770 [Desulfothermus okinawensis JCM 13304]